MHFMEEKFISAIVLKTLISYACVTVESRNQILFTSVVKVYICHDLLYRLYEKCMEYIKFDFYPRLLHEVP